MYFPEIGTIADAKKENLIPITVWLFHHDLDWLKSELCRIGSNEKRKAMIVRRGIASSYALFVNDVTDRFSTYDESKDIDIDE